MGELIPQIILFLFVALLFSFSVHEIKKYINFPLAPGLLVAGALLKLIGQQIPNLEDSVNLIDELDPDLIFLVFLPPLIFSASLSIEWYVLKHEITQIIPLVTSVVVGQALLMSLVIYYIIDPGFEWVEGVLLGSILSATDHVAIGSMLKEIEISKRLETLLTGEILLNDAAVILLFSITLEEIEDGSINGISLGFFRLFFGGIFVGGVCGFLFGNVLKQVTNDPVQETSLLIFSTYLIYYLAEESFLEVSGAIAVMTWGLFMSAYGKTLISPNVEHFMRGFWEVAEENIEALIFIICGMIMTEEKLYEEHIERDDIWKAIVLLVFSYLIRGFVIFVHYPILKRLGYGMSWKEAVFIALAGTKGTIALALSIVVSENEDIDETTRKKLLFYISFLVATTILLGSYIPNYVAKKLGLEKENIVQERNIVNISKWLFTNNEKKILELQNDKTYQLANWEKVHQISGSRPLIESIFKESRLGRIILKENSEETELSKLIEKYREEVLIELPEVLKSETRARFLNNLKQIYWENFEIGHSYGYSTIVLINSANHSLDNLLEELSDWNYVEKALYNEYLFNKALVLGKIPLIGRVFRSWVQERIALSYDASITFVKVHEEASEKLEEFNYEFYEEILEESRIQIEKCKKFMITNIENLYPEIIIEVQSNLASRSILSFEKSQIEEICETGLIKEEKYQSIVKKINRKLQKLSLSEKLPIFSLQKLLTKRFPNADPDWISNLLKVTEKTTFEANQILFSENEQASGAFLIMDGRVSQSSDWIDTEHHLGSIVGLESLLPQMEFHRSSAKCLSSSEVVFLPKEYFLEKSIVEDLYRESALHLLLMNKREFEIENVKEEYIEKLVQTSVLTRYESGQEISLKNGMFLLKGKFEGARAFCFVYPKNEVTNSSKERVVLEVDEFISEEIKNEENISRALNRFYEDFLSQPKPEVLKKLLRKNTQKEYTKQNSLINTHRD